MIDNATSSFPSKYYLEKQFYKFIVTKLKSITFSKLSMSVLAQYNEKDENRAIFITIQMHKVLAILTLLDLKGLSEGLVV
jgi:hypothetical protein